MVDVEKVLRLAHCDRASHYYRVAWEYLEAYNLIAAQRPADFDEVVAPKLFLLCHALEVAMKGWLVLREGASKTDLARTRPSKKNPDVLGHNLEALARAAGKHYPVLLANRDTMHRLNASYWGDGTRDYEYPEGNRVLNHVSPSELARLVKACADDLLVAASAERRLVGDALGLDDDNDD